MSSQNEVADISIIISNSEQHLKYDETTSIWDDSKYILMRPVNHIIFKFVHNILISLSPHVAKSLPSNQWDQWNIGSYANVQLNVL